MSSITAPHLLIKYLLPLFIIFGLLTPSFSYAKSLSLQSVSMRIRISDQTLLGQTATANFKAVDVSANFGLPWKGKTETGWNVSSRLMTSAGIFQGEGEYALAISLIPQMVLWSEASRFSLDLGTGAALFSRHHFGVQDFGGPFEFALTLGITYQIDNKLGAGYRFLHYSDAGVNGSDTVGADLHMIEISYKY